MALDIREAAAPTLGCGLGCTMIGPRLKATLGSLAFPICPQATGYGMCGV